MKQAEKTYLKTFCFFSFIFIFLIAVFNYVIDPYQYFGTQTVSGVNEKKLTASAERFDCALKIMCKKPKAALFGSSRVKAGYEASYYSQLVSADAFKASLSGARFDEIFSYFEHVMHNQDDVKAIFISLDFFAFSKHIKPIPEFLKDRLSKKTAILNDRFKLFLSWPTIKYSFQTWKKNYYNPPVTHPFTVKIDEEDIEISQELLNEPENFLKHEIKGVFKDFVIDPSKVRQFETIVQRCEEKNIDLKLVFSPVHAIYFESLYQSGRWDDFEDLKKKLCKIAPIYDFSGFSEYNQESLNSSMHDRTYYFEVSHFKPVLGRIILDHVYGIKPCAHDTGFLLTPDTIETVLKTQREQRDLWRKNHQESIEWVTFHLFNNP